MNYAAGKTIKKLREKKGITQRQLAELLFVSDKTVSKWETGKGLPDIGIIEELSNVLGISVSELFDGDIIENENTAFNMMKTCLYVCPKCGNIVYSTGEGCFTCCGNTLSRLDLKASDGEHIINTEAVENEYYVHLKHEMTKEHYISFMVYLSHGHIQLEKLYPEQNAECRFCVKGHGEIYAYCTRHGLYKKIV